MIVTYAVIILALRAALLAIAALGFLVTGFICWHEAFFHGVDGITLGLRDLCFCLFSIFVTLLIVSVVNLLDLSNQHLLLFAVVNTLTVAALASLCLFFVKLVKKMIKDFTSERPQE